MIDTLPNGVVSVQNPANGLWDPVDAWRLQEVMRVGAAEGDEAQVFGEVTDATVDRYGRLYVLDRQAKQVRVFGGDGDHVRSLGREGGGPGEFRNPIGLDWDARGRLWVVDQGNGRYSVFDTAGNHLTSYRRAIGAWGLPWQGGFDAEGRLYEFVDLRDPETATSRPVYELTLQGDRLVQTDSFVVPKDEQALFSIWYGGSRTITAVPFSERLVKRLDGHGGLWFARTDHYRLYHQSLAGDTLRIVQREYDHLPVSEEERSAAIARIERIIQRTGGTSVDYSLIPEHKPALQTFAVDDGGYLWVVPSTRREAGRVLFDIFEPRGWYLGIVAVRLEDSARSWRLSMLPLPPTVIRDRLVLALFDELDVDHVIVYQIRKE